ncbi:MAG: DUF4832 domain-containing protein [Armatimonadetes bacterium]|nr:DUF4832 domain-containing protein [Armatimonadota bacterium]
MITALLAAHFLGTTYEWTYKPAPGPIVNPLKGWAPYVGEGSQIQQPYSMVYFNVKWNELEPRDGVYKFNEWEKKTWDIPAAKGKLVVFRVSMDYPTEKTGVPQWLIDAGLKMTPYTDYGGGKSPDYSDPRLQKALLKFIKALGARYNSNPRVAFIQVGLLGFWGEWHTWPRTELFASDDFQKQVLDTMTKAFPDKKLMARNPSGVAGSYTNLGFHDDMIPQDTVGSEDWKFLPGILAHNLGANWKQYPRGGEMVPFASKQYMVDEYSTTLKAVQDVHFTWIGPYCPALENIESDTFKSNCRQLIRTMGYQFSLTKASAQIDGKNLAFRIEGTNDGVAPFYYPWTVRFALLDDQDHVAAQADSTIDIRKWLPGNFRANGSVSFATKPGKYRLALGVIDPYNRVPDVEFANQIDKIDGWQTLGQVQIKP